MSLSDSEEERLPLRGFSGYSINQLGQVADERQTPNVFVNPEMINGQVVVRLVGDGAFHAHAVLLDNLMVDHFIDVPARTHLYDLVHIDGNIWNCRLDNYGWRRRWIPPSMRE